MKRCPTCRAENYDDVKNCQYCGNSMSYFTPPVQPAYTTSYPSQEQKPMIFNYVFAILAILGGVGAGTSAMPLSIIAIDSISPVAQWFPFIIFGILQLWCGIELLLRKKRGWILSHIINALGIMEGLFWVFTGALAIWVAAIDTTEWAVLGYMIGIPIAIIGAANLIYHAAALTYYIKRKKCFRR